MKLLKAKTAAEALFYSRGDNSRTHKKELAVWKKAGIQPAGDWYRVGRTFMMATQKMACENGGCFMPDSSTWVADKKEYKNLQILFHGDRFLTNAYHALCQPEGATPGHTFAVRFIDFLASDRGQRIIRE